MKKILSLLLSAVFLFSVVNLTVMADTEQVDLQSATLIYELDDDVFNLVHDLNDLYEEIGIQFEYVGTKVISDSNSRSSAGDEYIGVRVTHYDGVYINGNGVAVRTGPGLSRTILGYLYNGDIVWFLRDRPADTYADGYYWREIVTDSMSNMGQRDGWCATAFFGRPW